MNPKLREYLILTLSIIAFFLLALTVPYLSYTGSFVYDTLTVESLNMSWQNEEAQTFFTNDGAGPPFISKTIEQPARYSDEGSEKIILSLLGICILLLIIFTMSMRHIGHPPERPNFSHLNGTVKAINKALRRFR